MFRVTLDMAGQVLSQGQHLVTSASRTDVSTGSNPFAALEDSAADFVFAFDMTAVPAATTGLTINNAWHIHDAADSGTVTTANGAVSNLNSVAPGTKTFLQATANNQPAHSISNQIITFASTSQTDADGDFLATGTGAGTLANLLGNTNSQDVLGIVYVLFRFATVPTWRTYLFAGGTQHNTFADERNGIGLCVLSGGAIRAWRAGGGSTISSVQTTGTVAANVWHAAAFVFNDDRVTPGTPDNRARLRVRSAAGGNFTTVEAGAGTNTAFWSTSANNPRARIGRGLHDADGGQGNWQMRYMAADVASIAGGDPKPPTSDAVIDANLAALLAMV